MDERLLKIHTLTGIIKDAEPELELIMAESEPSRNDRRRNAAIAGEKGIRRGLVPRELPMSEVMPSPLPPSKTLEEQAAEILALIEEIISTAPETEEQEKIPA